MCSLRLATNLQTSGKESNKYHKNPNNIKVCCEFKCIFLLASHLTDWNSSYNFCFDQYIPTNADTNHGKRAHSFKKHLQINNSQLLKLYVVDATKNCPVSCHHETSARAVGFFNISERWLVLFLIAVFMPGSWRHEPGSGTSFFNKFFQSNVVDVKIEYDAQNLKA